MKVPCLVLLLLVYLTTARDVHYVMEPFEGPPNYESDGALVATLAEDALFGDASHAMTFSGSLTGSISSSVRSGLEAHSCWGSDRISLWYKVVANDGAAAAAADASDNWSLSLTLANDQQTSFMTPPATLVPGNGDEWFELVWAWDDFVGTTDDIVNNIREWKLTMEGSSTADSSTMSVLVDQLSCSGENLLGAFFREDATFIQGPSPSSGTWNYGTFDSQLSLDETTFETRNDGSFFVDYLIQHKAVWGGNLRMDHTAPENAYYNLSEADSIHLQYRVSEVASPPQRPHLRLILLEERDCIANCSSANGLENFYSFNYVLSNVNDEDDEHAIEIELAGDNDPTSPFWFTGWYGAERDLTLQKAHIKGFSLELSIDREGRINSTASGAFTVGPLDIGGPLPPKVNGTCTFEPEIMVEHAVSFTTIHYESDCCLRCEEDKDCNYAVAVNGGADCFIASEVVPGEVILIPSEELASSQRFYIASNKLQWCTACDCDAANQSIDCRGQDLVTTPSIFEEEWDVKRMDLSNNDRLVVIGDALAPFGHSLVELHLPRNLKHLSQLSMSSFSSSMQIVTEGAASDTIAKNIITSPEERFSDICCSPVPLTLGDDSTPGLSVCNMTQDRLGGDTIYEPFFQYDQTIESTKLTTSSSLLSEATDSLEKCAEYCKVSIDCHYFTFDQRVEQTSNTCVLTGNKAAKKIYHCCEQTDDFADLSKTLPGYIAGRPPRARATDDNAQVLISPIVDLIDEDTDYIGSFEVSLGTTPMRGAVWVEPYVASDASVTVSFVPSQVTLYSSDESQLVSVHVSNLKRGSVEALVIGNQVTSCDAAYSSIPDESALSLVMNARGDSAEGPQVIWIASLAGILLLSCLFVFCFVRRVNKKRLEDQVWKIDMKELHFPDPQIILGRGTFGLVLLAEFRGTEVAVKRVLPKDSKGASTRSTGGSSAANLDDIDLEEAAPSSHLGSESKTSSNTSSRRLGTHYLKSGKLSMGPYDYTADPSHTTSRLKQGFMQEMRQLSMLRHPCITTVMGAVIDPKLEPMLVMERMSHGSLYDLLQNETFAIECEVLLYILRDITQGLRFLHASTPPVIHGDIKAQNILVDERFRAKVSDFGLTQKKQLGAVGTPFWMAPELLRGDASNSSESDVYSFGIILYEVYSRQEPYADAMEEYDMVIKAISDPAVAKRPILPQSSPEKIKAMMGDCCLDDPKQRPTFAEIDLQLQRLNAETVSPQGSCVHGATKHNSKQNTERLLFDIFPKEVAESLRDGRPVEPKHCEMATIFFSDIVGFTKISSSLPPIKISDLLGRLYNKFDALSTEMAIFKVETIGDAYMAVTNLVEDQKEDHVKRIADFSIAAIAAANSTLIDTDDPGRGTINIRIGLHSGPVVASVVGTRNPRYCLFGDTVNTAARMESSSEKNRIHCSSESAELLRSQYPTLPLMGRGLVSIKGKGEMLCFWVNRSDKQESDASGSNQQPMGITAISEDGLLPVAEDGDNDAWVSLQ